MKKYRNEAYFSKALVMAMRNKGWFVQRIESGETGKGIPDIYAVSPNKVAMWIELKRVHQYIDYNVTVPWRPGQQAWLHEVYRRGQRAYTLIAMDDCFLMVPACKIYSQNRIQPFADKNIIRCNTIQELL